MNHTGVHPGWILAAFVLGAATGAYIVDWVYRGQADAPAQARVTQPAQAAPAATPPPASAEFGIAPGSMAEWGPLMAEDFARYSSATKVALTEFAMTQGRWPGDGAELGIGLSEAVDGHLLKRMRIRGPRIEFDFLASGSFPGATVVLEAPAQSLQSPTGIRWDCSSPDYADIGRVLAGCRYRPG